MAGEYLRLSILFVIVGCSDPGRTAKDGGDFRAEDADPDVDTDTDTDVDADTGAATDTSSTGDCGTGATAPTFPLTPPGGISAESSWCWFLGPIDGQLGLFVAGMDSGSIAEYGRYGPVHNRFHTPGMAFTGTSLVFGGYNGYDFVWHELDLTAGTLAVGLPHGDGAENAASWYAGHGLVVRPHADRHHALYASGYDLLSGAAPIEELLGLGGHSRFAIDGTTFYGSSFYTNAFAILDLVTPTSYGFVNLENYDTWVWGIGVAGGFLHVIDDGRGYPGQTASRIARFDGAGGAVDNVPLVGYPWTEFPSGLWCDAP